MWSFKFCEWILKKGIQNEMYEEEEANHYAIVCSL